MLRWGKKNPRVIDDAGVLILQGRTRASLLGPTTTAEQAGGAEGEDG